MSADLRDERFLDHPLRADGRGIPATTTAADHLEDLILQVLFTNPGERLHLPEFGVGVRRLVFEPNNEALRTSTQFLITTNLNRWLGDRIIVDDVSVASEPGAEEAVTIEIAYRVRATRDARRIQIEARP